jgi:molecular chaperone GrpE
VKGKKETPPKAAPPAAAKGSGRPEPAGGADRADEGVGAASGPDDAAAELERRRAREDELLRALAELQNAQRRRRQEMDQALAYAHEPLIRALLPVLDDLERAVAATEGREGDPIGAGVRIVLDQLRGTLERDGLEDIRPANGVFDPQLHDALMQRPAPGMAPQTVLEVVKPGYRYRGRVIRHAQVVVSGDAGPPAEARATPPDRSAPHEGADSSNPPEEGSS